MTHRAARGAEVPLSSVLETERLTLRRLTVDDDQFIFELLNDPAWIEFIGDKGVRTLADARDYIRNGPMAMYEREGFGLWLTQRKSDDAPIGMCGLIKRDTLQDVDIGFAFLPAFRATGYAFEAASAVLVHGRGAFGLKRIVAITSPSNARSALLLERLGMTFEKRVTLSADDEVLLYASAS